MNLPEKLFQNSPEWEPGDGVLQWHNRETNERGIGENWECWLGPLGCELEIIPGNVHAQIFWLKSRDFDTLDAALDWLRARIIAHRDELVRVTG